MFTKKVCYLCEEAKNTFKKHNIKIDEFVEVEGVYNILKMYKKELDTSSVQYFPIFKIHGYDILYNTV